MFTINLLGLHSKLRCRLGTTNIIDNGHSAVRYRMRHIQNWQSGSMAQRWAAAVFNVTSKGVRRIMGYEHLWMLKAAGRAAKDRRLAQKAIAG